MVARGPPVIAVTLCAMITGVLCWCWRRGRTRRKSPEADTKQETAACQEAPSCTTTRTEASFSTHNTLIHLNSLAEERQRLLQDVAASEQKLMKYREQLRAVEADKEGWIREVRRQEGVNMHMTDRLRQMKQEQGCLSSRVNQLMGEKEELQRQLHQEVVAVRQLRAQVKSLEVANRQLEMRLSSTSQQLESACVSRSRYEEEVRRKMKHLGEHVNTCQKVKEEVEAEKTAMVERSKEAAKKLMTLQQEVSQVKREVLSLREEREQLLARLEKETRAREACMKELSSERSARHTLEHQLRVAQEALTNMHGHIRRMSQESARSSR